jgi:hypothetical protein
MRHAAFSMLLVAACRSIAYGFNHIVNGLLRCRVEAGVGAVKPKRPWLCQNFRGGVKNGPIYSQNGSIYYRKGAV